MDDPRDEAEKLGIRCPGCGQRFKVGLELRDRMVECGTCEHRFRVNDEVLLRTKKFYPGEHRGRSLDNFSRVPKTMGTTQANFQTVQYADEPLHHAIETNSPLRLVFGFIAVTVAVLIALMLIFGGSVGGLLYGTGQSKRLMLAGFTAFVSGALLIAANPRARTQAILGAIAAAAGLVSLPYLFTEGTTTAGPVIVEEGPAASRKPAAEDLPPPDPELVRLKKEIGYDPLEREIIRYQASAGSTGRSAAGIWLRGLREFHKLQVKDYIIRSTGADPSSHMYPRPPDYLMVVSGVTDDLAELARLCERFGEVGRTFDALRVIEVVVNNESFQEGPLEKLADPENPAFYELNRRELESIDLERARNAVGRLAPAEPKLYRKDVVSRMQKLLKEGDVPLQAEIGTALLTWSEAGDGSEEPVRAAIEKISARAGDVPESLVKFLVSRKDLAVIPLVDALWAADSNQWEELYGGLGTPIEDKVLARYDNATVTLKMSAARLLGKVGTAKSLPVLEASREGSNPELRVHIDRALAAIKARG